MGKKKEIEVKTEQAIVERVGFRPNDRMTVVYVVCQGESMGKRKPRPTNEALVLSYTLDKNDEPVYNVRAVNGEQLGVEFKLKMKIPNGVVIQGRNYRNKANADHLVGQHIEYAWENLSEDRVPCKPVGLCVREVICGEGRF